MSMCVCVCVCRNAIYLFFKKFFRKRLPKLVYPIERRKENRTIYVFTRVKIHKLAYGGSNV